MHLYASNNLPQDKTSIVRFADALRTAIHDKSLENHNSEICYYYDADVVLRMVNGFSQFRPNPSIGRDDRVLLVRSLLSCGYLGRGSILRPHALEIDENIRTKVDFTGEMARGDFKKALNDFLSQWHIIEIFEELRELIENSPSDIRIERFLRELQKVGHTAFIAIELASGNWQQRLVRLARENIINFTQIDDSMRLTLQDPVVWTFCDMISKVRTRRPLSTLQDATALAMLARQIRRHEAGEKVPLVRFYTETPALRDAWTENPYMRELLSYGQPEGSKRDLLNFVGRDADYFILRASFECLRFSGLGLAKGTTVAVSLGELRGVSSELDRILVDKPDEKDLVEALALSEGMRLGSESLYHHIFEFESLSFLRSIWSNYGPPDSMRRTISGLSEVWHFMEEGSQSGIAFREKIWTELSDIKGKLEFEVREARSWYDIFKSLLASSSKVFRERFSVTGQPEPYNDLGLIRWGMELSPENYRKIDHLLSKLTAADEGDWWGACADLVDSVRDADSSIDNCVVVSGILWLLNEFQLIVDTIKRLVQRHDSIPFGVELLVAGASVHEKSLSFRDKEEIIDSLRKKLLNFLQPLKARFSIGYGYCLFHCWESEQLKTTRISDRFNADRDEHQRQTSIVKSWLYESLRVGEEALHELEFHSLPWAFALNHCAYVSTHLDVASEKTREHIEHLLKLETQRDLWNYRFSDTLGYYYYRRAKYLFETAQDEETLQQVRRLIFDAIGIYDQTRLLFYDREIPVHKNDLTALAARVGVRKTSQPRHGVLGVDDTPDRI